MNILASFGSLLWRHKTLIIVVLMAVYLIVMDDNCVMSQVEQVREIKSLEAELVDLKAQFEHDSRELKRLDTDPHMAEQLAREQYLMKRDGEDVFLFPEPTDSL